MTSEQRRMAALGMTVIKHALEKMVRRSRSYLAEPAEIQLVDLVQDILDLQVAVAALAATMSVAFGDLSEDEHEAEP